MPIDGENLKTTTTRPINHTHTHATKTNKPPNTPTPRQARVRRKLVKAHRLHVETRGGAGFKSPPSRMMLMMTTVGTERNIASYFRGFFFFNVA